MRLKLRPWELDEGSCDVVIKFLHTEGMQYWNPVQLCIINGWRTKWMKSNNAYNSLVRITKRVEQVVERLSSSSRATVSDFMMIKSIPSMREWIIFPMIRYQIESKSLVKRLSVCYWPCVFPYAVYVSQGRLVSNCIALPANGGQAAEVLPQSTCHSFSDII